MNETPPIDVVVEQPAVSQAAPRTDSGLKTRMKSALILAPIVLLFIGVGSVPFALLMVLAAGISMSEWYRMITANGGGSRFIEVLSIVSIVVATIAAAMVKLPHLAVVLYGALAFMLCCAIWANENKTDQKLLVFGLFYIGYAIATMIWVRTGTAYGLYNFMLLLCIVWASDIFAYFAGRAIGGPKLAPRISPKKTWAGFIGSSVGAAAVAAAFGIPFLTNAMGVVPPGGLGMMGLAIMGAVLAGFGQMGDLFISMFKRHFNVKDTGSIIPGHGGVLDRIDALLLVSILYATLIYVLSLTAG